MNLFSRGRLAIFLLVGLSVLANAQEEAKSKVATTTKKPTLPPPPPLPSKSSSKNSKQTPPNSATEPKPIPNQTTNTEDTTKTTNGTKQKTPPTKDTKSSAPKKTSDTSTNNQNKISQQKADKTTQPESSAKQETQKKQTTSTEDTTKTATTTKPTEEIKTPKTTETDDLFGDLFTEKTTDTNPTDQNNVSQKKADTKPELSDAKPAPVKDFFEEKKKHVSPEQLNKKNESATAENTDTTWNSLSIEEKAQYLQKRMENKEQLSEAAQKELQRRMHEFLILLLNKQAYEIMEKLTKNPNIAQLSDLIIIFDKLISQIITPDYLNRLKNLQKEVACFKKNKNKKQMDCSAICQSKEECVGKILRDAAALFEPFINAGIGSTTLANKQVKGMLPLFFSVIAPGSAATENVIALSIMLESGIQLLQEAGRMLEKSSQKGAHHEAI